MITKCRALVTGNGAADSDEEHADRDFRFLSIFKWEYRKVGCVSGWWAGGERSLAVFARPGLGCSAAGVSV